MRRLFKFVFKWLLRLALLVVVLVVAALLLKDSVLRLVAEHRIRKETGMEAKIGRFSSGLLSPAVTIENLKLYNPAEFGGGLFLDVPELHFELDRLALAGRKLRLVLVRFNLAELDIVRNEAGQTNIFSLGAKVQAARKGGGGGGLGRWLEGFQFDGIDVLNLSLGKARFIDLKEPRNNRDIDVQMKNQVFKNVKSEADLYGILFMAWLRSGGKLALAPGDPAAGFSGGGGGKVEVAAPAR
jgi:hypothetical protein